MESDLQFFSLLIENWAVDHEDRGNFIEFIKTLGHTPRKITTSYYKHSSVCYFSKREIDKHNTCCIVIEDNYDKKTTIIIEKTWARLLHDLLNMIIFSHSSDRKNILPEYKAGFVRLVSLFGGSMQNFSPHWKTK